MYANEEMPATAIMRDMMVKGRVAVYLGHCSLVSQGGWIDEAMTRLMESLLIQVATIYHVP